MECKFPIGVVLFACEATGFATVFGIYLTLVTSVLSLGFPGAASGKEPACQCRRYNVAQYLDWQDPPEEGMATHSSILAPWTEDPGGLQSIGLQRVLSLSWVLALTGPGFGNIKSRTIKFWKMPSLPFILNVSCF